MPGANLQQVTEANASGRLTSTAVKNSAGTVLQGQSLTYAIGSTQKALVQSIVNQPANTTTSYSYGTGAGSGASIGALLEAQTKNGAGSITDDWVYNSDLAGNRTKRTHAASGTTSITSYAYNAANQMCWSLPATSTNPCGTVPAGATSYSYDHAGNQTTGQSYDALSRMTSTGTTSLGYLTPGNQELTNVGTTTLQNGLLGLMRQVPSTGSATTYTRRPDGTPIAQRSSTAKQYLYGDQLGSITAVADNNTNSLTRTYTYDPDGNRAAATTGTGSGAPTDLGYATGYTLPGGLIHYGARYYNPTLARWTQQDPLNQVASLQEANRYTYVGGDPANNADPAGQCAFDRRLTPNDLRACRRGRSAGGPPHPAADAPVPPCAASGQVIADSDCGADRPEPYEGPVPMLDFPNSGAARAPVPVRPMFPVPVP